jgi:hypothetical protein
MHWKFNIFLSFFLLLKTLVAFGAQAGFSGESPENGLTAEAQVSTESVPFGKIDPEIAKIAYTGGEKFYYDISWTGGIKIGELRLEIKKVPDQKDTYEILANITTDNGMFHYIYPVKDTHITRVTGNDRLPIHYEIWQKEGRSYTAHRVLTYEQLGGKVIYTKDGDPTREFTVSGTTHNEFSSFFGSRVMALEVGKPFKVPTFADDKRNEVVVETMRKTHLEDTVIGPVDTVEVMPILTFTGLYDKRGDTVIWYTNDECRVPVLINSKIVIGSLTSTLVYYSNPACEKYSAVQAQNSNQRLKR